VEEVLERYRNYLTVERGLEHATTRGYVDAVRSFLQGRVLPDGVALDLRHLAAADVIAFVVARCPCALHRDQRREQKAVHITPHAAVQSSLFAPHTTGRENIPAAI
jgi:Phage integrase, N-terminal SAM-like domain